MTTSINSNLKIISNLKINDIIIKCYELLEKSKKDIAKSNSIDEVINSIYKNSKKLKLD